MVRGVKSQRVRARRKAHSCRCYKQMASWSEAALLSPHRLQRPPVMRRVVRVPRLDGRRLVPVPGALGKVLVVAASCCRSQLLEQPKKGAPLTYWLQP